MTAIAMTVDQVLLDPVLGTPLLVLREEGGARRLPIGIGQVEAVAIVSQLEKIPMMRPMTHDLMRNLLGELDVTVERVTVTELRDGIFFAEITIRSRGAVMRVDARPSDSVALALRAGAPIFVEEAVLRAAAAEACNATEPVEAGPRPLGVEAAGRADVLEDLEDEDFGKWKM